MQPWDAGFMGSIESASNCKLCESVWRHLLVQRTWVWYSRSSMGNDGFSGVHWWMPSCLDISFSNSWFIGGRALICAFSAVWRTLGNFWSNFVIHLVLHMPWKLLYEFEHDTGNALLLQYVGVILMLKSLNDKGYNPLAITLPSLKELSIMVNLAGPVLLTMLSKVRSCNLVLDCFWAL